MNSPDKRAAATRKEPEIMKILFYGTKNYDEQFFEKLLPEVKNKLGII